MYLTRLEIKNLKLIENLELDFTRDGAWRQWTVLVGKNGRCKTAILQAIALAAAGDRHAESLGETVKQSYRPRLQLRAAAIPDKTDKPPSTRIRADFTLEPTIARGAHRRKKPSTPRLREIPGVGMQGSEPVEFISEIELPHEVDRFEVRSWIPGRSEATNPLNVARDKGLPYWFTVGYGTSRHLRFTRVTEPNLPTRSQLHRERLGTLFTPEAELMGIGFADRLGPARTHVFGRFLQALAMNSEGLLPELKGVELTGRGGIKGQADLLESDRIIQTLPGGTSRKLPATWLSHGYQSSLSWMSDLLGHALFDDPAFDDYSNQEKVRFDELQGLVLIDELDLHIHPTWQRGLVAALSETFPGLQFIATTHSPLLLSALRPDEVVALELGPDDTVRRQPLDVDPRVLTGSELYEEVFHTPSLPAQPLGAVLSDYEFWARNPYRDDRKEREVVAWRTQLEREGVAIPFDPVPRSPRGRP